MGSNIEMNQKIQAIIEKAIIVEKVYKDGAENATNKSLIKYFNSKILQRNSLVKELKTHLLKAEEITIDQNADAESLSSTKRITSEKDNQTLLEESIKIEKDILDHLEDILDKEYITMDLRNILSNHYNTIKIEYESIKTLEDVEKAYS